MGPSSLVRVSRSSQVLVPSHSGLPAGRTRSHAVAGGLPSGTGSHLAGRDEDLIYLAIMVLVAAAGITRLYMQQRRERLSVEKADSFWAGLERIAVHPDPRVTAPAKRRERTARPRRIGGRGRSASMDPARRAAAKRRIEKRRRIAAQRAAARRSAAARREASRRASGRQVPRQTAAARKVQARAGAARQRQVRTPDPYDVGHDPRELHARQAARTARTNPGRRRAPVQRQRPAPVQRQRSDDAARAPQARRQPMLATEPIPDVSQLPRIVVRRVEPRRIDIEDRHADWIDLREATSGRYVR